jgi:hypothetical protein
LNLNTGLAKDLLDFSLNNMQYWADDR